MERKAAFVCALVLSVACDHQPSPTTPTPSTTSTIASSGFPSGKAYRLQVSGLSAKPATYVTGIQTTETGTLGTGLSQKTPVDLSKLTLQIENYNKGEFYMIEAISEDGTVYAADRVYPFPIESSDRDCHVWAELINKNKKSFGITGSGFVSNTEVRWNLAEEGGKEKKDGVARVNSDGRFAVPVAHSGGGGVGRFVAAGEGCQVTLLYEFGSLAIGPQ